MLFVEAFFRFGSITILIAISALIFRDGLKQRPLKFALLMNAALIGMFLTAGSEPLRLSGPLAIPIRFFDMMNLVFVWWFGLSLFDDDFRLGAREWIVFGVYGAAMFTLRLYFLGIASERYVLAEMVVVIGAIAMMAHLVWRALAGREEDLVEGRRRFRVWFAALIALTGGGSMILEQALAAFGADQALSLTITTIFVLPLGIVALLWLARLHPEALSFRKVESRRPEKPVLDAHEKDMQRRLETIMETERAFAEQGLTIGVLAARVGAPEHQLRALINRSMGYRNFSAFLNHYRLAEARKALADPARARTPVLTIAMDAGFSSLAPFNRAFKNEIGKTPTAYRADALAGDDLAAEHQAAEDQAADNLAGAPDQV